MITIKPAKNESRTRDLKRFRAVLTVGDRTIHLTTREVLDLAADAIRTAHILTKREVAVLKAAAPKGVPFTWAGVRYFGKGKNRD